MQFKSLAYRLSSKRNICINFEDVANNNNQHMNFACCDKFKKKLSKFFLPLLNIYNIFLHSTKYYNHRFNAKHTFFNTFTRIYPLINKYYKRHFVKGFLSFNYQSSKLHFYSIWTNVEMDPNESRVWNVKSIKWKSAEKKNGKRRRSWSEGEICIYVQIDRLREQR